MHIKRYVPPKKIPELFPEAFSEASVRWLIFNEQSNGFSRCVRRIGRKVLIDLDQFEMWIDQQRPGGVQ